MRASRHPGALLAALAVLTCSCDDGHRPTEALAADGSAEVAIEVVAPPAPEPPAEDPVAPPPPTEADLDEVVALSAPDRPDGLGLTSRFRRGDRVRRHVSWARTSEVAVAAGARNANARLESAVDAVFVVIARAVDKGALSTVEVRFETFDRTTSGSPHALPDDPAQGDAWTCRTDRSPVRCSTGPDTVITAPPWLVLSFDPLLPARPVQPGETWSRRIGVAPLLGMSDTGVARAEIIAEPAYETTDGHFSTLSMHFDGDDHVQALGRNMRARVAGTGALEFDLRRGRVVAYDVEWSAQANAERRAGEATVGFDRSTSVVLRMTELSTQ